MIKVVFILVIFISPIAVAAQDAGKEGVKLDMVDYSTLNVSQPRIIHISTYTSPADSVKPHTPKSDTVKVERVGTELMVFSLVSPEMYKDFESETKRVSQELPFKTKFLLIAVTEHDSDQKLEFMSRLYKIHDDTHDWLLSYKKAIDSMKADFRPFDVKTELIERH